MDENTPDVKTRRSPRQRDRLQLAREISVAAGMALVFAALALYDARLALLAAGLVLWLGGFVGLLRGGRSR